tara:strand:- start:157 stop:324 length:168 start_codon:yes stop_codon:yes gene_type:complete
MPTPEEQLAATQAELKAKAEEYNAIQQSQQEKVQEILKLQGAEAALRAVVSPPEG